MPAAQFKYFSAVIFRALTWNMKSTSISSMVWETAPIGCYGSNLSPPFTCCSWRLFSYWWTRAKSCTFAQFHSCSSFTLKIKGNPLYWCIFFSFFLFVCCAPSRCNTWRGLTLRCWFGNFVLEITFWGHSKPLHQQSKRGVTFSHFIFEYTSLAFVLWFINFCFIMTLQWQVDLVSLGGYFMNYLGSL